MSESFQEIAARARYLQGSPQAPSIVMSKIDAVLELIADLADKLADEGPGGYTSIEDYLGTTGDER